MSKIISCFGNARATNLTTTARTFDLGVNFDEGRRFAAVGREEIQDMTKKKNSPKTDQSTGFAVKVLQAFCKESAIAFPKEDKLALNKVLCKFYIAARNQKGELYKLNTMKSIRFSLQRYFLDNYKIDIIAGKDFNESNNIFQNVLKNMKAVGKGDTTH